MKQKLLNAWNKKSPSFDSSSTLFPAKFSSICRLSPKICFVSYELKPKSLSDFFVGHSQKDFTFNIELRYFSKEYKDIKFKNCLFAKNPNI